MQHDVNELLSGAQLIKSKVSSFLKSFKDIHVSPVNYKSKHFTFILAVIQVIDKTLQF